MRELAHTKSAKEMIRIIEKRRARNRSVRSATKTALAKADRLMSGGELEGVTEAVRGAISAVDRAAKKGIIHPNCAARRKSRLAQKLNGVMQAEPKK
ncbi:30S ribosomal protein S20 [Chloroflexota bacterium]